MYSHRHLIPPVLLARAVAAESHCNADAVNKLSGAVGLGQILPSGSANRGNFTSEELRDPDLNNGNCYCRANAWSRRVLDGLRLAISRRQS
jgi:hypothetical protein